MKTNIIAQRRALRIISAVAAAAVSVLEFSPAEGLLVGATILLLFPLSVEVGPIPLSAAEIVAVAALLLHFVLPGGRCLKVCALVMPSLLLAYNCLCVVTVARKPTCLFRHRAPLVGLEKWSRMLYSMLAMLLWALLPAVGTGAVQFAVMSVLSIAFYALVFYKTWTGRLLIMTRSQERTIQNIYEGTLSSETAVDDVDRQRVNELYTKLITYMKVHKPYLDRNLSLSLVSARLLSNPVTLSRTINICSGRNFCQFVNWFRIDYAMELMKKAPLLKMTEVATRSGFNSIPSFNSAFKANVGVTPSDYAEKVKSDGITARERPSNSRARERKYVSPASIQGA